MKVINLWGGSCVGKSTTAAGLFFEMKKMHLNVELVTEYAKDVTWERRYNLLEDQIYIFAKQQRRISRLQDHDLEWAITDSPIPLGLCYASENYGQNFENLVIEVFNQYDNYNFLLSRNVPYNPIGRNQKTVEEAKIFDQRAKNILQKWNIPYQCIVGGEPAVRTILDICTT